MIRKALDTVKDKRMMIMTGLKLDQKCRSRASVLDSLLNFLFLIVWTVMLKALSYIKAPLKKIQGRSMDLYQVVDVIRNTQMDLRFLKSEESDFYQRCYDYAIRICNLIDIKPNMPRKNRETGSLWEYNCSHPLRLLSR